MTAVARLAIGNHPTMLGDVLITAETPPEEIPTLPTVRDLQPLRSAGRKRVPNELRQKIVVVDGNLVLGWSGSYFTAQLVIQEIMERNTIAPLTMKSLTDYFDSLDAAVWDRLEILGFIKEGNGCWSFSRSASEVQTAHFGKVGLAGTGAEALGRFLASSQIPGGIDRHANPFEQSYGTALHLAGSFLHLEQLTQESIANHYGCGYEVATLTENGFRKLDNISYVFWRVLFTEKGQPAIRRWPLRVFRYAYEGDLLLIRAVTWGEESSAALTDDLFLIPPIYRTYTDAELARGVDPPPSLNCEWYCNSVGVYFPKQEPGLLTIAGFQRVGEENWIRFNERPDGFDIEWSDAFTRYIADQIQSQIAETS